MTFRLERHKWWTADRTRLVDTGDPDAAFLAYPGGTELAETEARRVGLLAAPARPVVEVERVQEKIRSTPPENKMGPAPRSKTPTKETL